MAGLAAIDLGGFHAGDTKVLAWVYRQRVAAVERAVSCYCRGAEAECIVHDVFLQMVERPEVRQFQGGDLGAWLCTIARRRAIDHLRRQGRFTLLDDPRSLEGKLPHGEVKNNEGYLSLADGRLTATELADWILTPSLAETNHVIIDACKSYFIVQEKRAGGERRPVDRPFYYDRGLLRRFPGTGFVLSTSSAQSSHEWEEFQAGIFSHEVRSGLLGAADVNGDGRVSYSELRAFVEVANSAIPNDRFRPSIFVRPPHGDGSRSILDAAHRPTASLILPPGGRYFVEDSRGVRLADLHSGATAEVTLLLPIGGRLYVHDLENRLEYQLETKPVRRQLVAMQSRPSSYRIKGAAHEAFQKIFSRPFGQSAYREAVCRYAEEEPGIWTVECVQCGCSVCPGPPVETPLPAPPLAAPPAVVAQSARPERPLWARLIEAHLATSFAWRNFDFSDPIKPERPANYRSGSIPILGVGLQLHPLAWLHPGWVGNFGLSLRFDRSVALRARLWDGTDADTTLQRVEVGLHYRWNLGGRPTWPVLKAGLGWGRDSFEIHYDEAIYAGGSVPLPNVAYSYLKLTFLDLDVPLHAGPRLAVGVTGRLDYLRAFSAGDIERPDTSGYGSASTHGIVVGGGVYLQFRRAYVRALGEHRRFGLAFSGSCIDGSAGSCKAAGGALDTRSSFTLLGGFAY